MLAECAKEACQAAHVAGRAEQIRQACESHDAVLQRVAGARGRLRAIARAPTSGRRAHARGRRPEMQVQVVAHGDIACTGAGTADCRRPAGRQRRRRLEHALLAVKIARAPRSASRARWLRPRLRCSRHSSGAIEHRETGRAARAGSAVAVALRDERDAVLAQQTLGVLARVLALGGSMRANASSTGRQRGRSLPCRLDELVVDACAVRPIVGSRSSASAPSSRHRAVSGQFTSRLSISRADPPVVSAGTCRRVNCHRPVRTAQVERAGKFARSASCRLRVGPGRVAERRRSARAGGFRPRRR